MATMAETVALIGQKVDTVAHTVAKIDSNVDKLTTAQAATDIHIKTIIGPPSLEDRVNKSMDEKDSHKHNNVMQAITAVQELLRLQQEVATLKMESSIASVADSLKTVAKSVEHTEAMRKENNDAQLRWQEKQERTRAEEKVEDVKWKAVIDKKINIALGVICGVEAVLAVAFKAMDWWKH